VNEPDEQHMAQHVRQARLEALLGTVHGETTHLPAWLRPTRGEHRLPVLIAVLAIIAVQLRMPAVLAPPPKYLLPAVEVALVIVLTVMNPTRIVRESTPARVAGLGLFAAAAIDTAWTAGRLVYLLASGEGGDVVHKPTDLLVNGGAVWLLNIAVSALAYWEFDRGGPAARAAARKPHPDFLFAQMTVPELTSRDWEPTFVDYLYLSFTNATAFSPTDTLPLSRWAKLTMMVQSAISLVTAALVIARAVNIFS
jgi:uncharacterized membrane protein